MIRLPLVIAAALVSAVCARAAAPPVPLPEAPAPGPLFNPDQIHVNPLHLSLAVFGSTAQPITGRLVALGGIYAGEQHRAWSLDGPLTNRYNRISLGAATLVLGGSGVIPGTSALTQIANLEAGHRLDCWALIDTDRFRALPNDWLREVTDNRPIGAGGVEADIYSRVLIRAHYTSSAAFRQAARSDVTYTHIFAEPERYRGVVVRVEGRLLRVNRYDPPHEATEAGVNDLYEAWIFNEQLGANPYCVLFSEWPADLPRKLLGQNKIPGVIKVALDGYFFKKYRYKANDRYGSERDAPLVIGHGLLVLSTNAPPTNYSTVPITILLYVFAGTLFALIGGVIGLTYWYRRSDNRVRRRILARMPEFALPPPDAPPMAAPVATPVRSLGTPVAIPQRRNLPAGYGDRGDSSPGDRGGLPGKKEHPPDEGAGA